MLDVIIKTAYDELPDVLNQLENNDFYGLDMEQHCISVDGDQIITEGPTIIIEDLGLTIIEGTYFVYNPDIGECEPDFSLTLIYKSIGILDYDAYDYFASDPPLVALRNHLNCN